MPAPAKPVEEKKASEQRLVPREARLVPSSADNTAHWIALGQAAPDEFDDEDQADDRPADAPSTEPPRQGVRRRVEAENAPSRGIGPAALPIDVSITPDGRILIASQDTKALDLLEELIAQVAPPRRDYRVFKLRYADSFWVASYLDEFFETDAKPKSGGGTRYIYYYDPYSSDNKEDPSYRLSKRRQLKFIDDPDTNSILVQGADSGQLKTIEDLIAVYDQPQQADASSARLTAVFSVRYSKALAIAEAVKDVYRDLLSSNDKALQNNKNEERKTPAAGTTYIFNEGGDTSNEKERTRVSFKGKLSIGVDEVTNTLLVSAEGEILMRNVTEMIKSLDEAAKPLASVTVVRMNGSTNASRVQEVLRTMLMEPKPAAKQPPQQPQRPGQQQQPINGAEGAVVVQPQ
jgi:hypothetical protein